MSVLGDYIKEHSFFEKVKEKFWHLDNCVVSCVTRVFLTFFLMFSKSAGPYWQVWHCWGSHDHRPRNDWLEEGGYRLLLGRWSGCFYSFKTKLEQVATEASESRKLLGNVRINCFRSFFLSSLHYLLLLVRIDQLMFHSDYCKYY